MRDASQSRIGPSAQFGSTSNSPASGYLTSNNHVRPTEPCCSDIVCYALEVTRTYRQLLADALAAWLPVALVAFANIQFILNHFYGRAPYLLDAGWGSGLVHRSGPELVNPSIACDYARTFYGVHVSPFLSLLSILSYAAPVQRIEWYALSQAIVYAPLALTVYLLHPSAESRSLRQSALIGLTALAFCFSGGVLLCIDYPHFEPAIATFECLMLACLVTGRKRLGWLMLALTVSLREDAGLHTALTLLPLMYISFRGGDVGVSRRTLLRMAAIALGMSLLAVVVQRLFFPARRLFQTEYLGEPALAHLTVRTILDRIDWVARNCPFITLPLLASVLVAAVRRDARYLLGWAAATPWLVANLLAYQTEKWCFAAYAGFPFLVAFFWTLLYGVAIDRWRRDALRVTLKLLFILTCILTTLAIRITHPSVVPSVLSGAVEGAPPSARQLRAATALLASRTKDLGDFRVDEPIAALALESVALHNTYHPGSGNFDTLLFHQLNPQLDARALTDLSAHGIEMCTHLVGTGLVVCSKLDEARKSLSGLPTDQLPPMLALGLADGPTRALTVGPNGVVVRSDSPSGPTLGLRRVQMGAAGSFEVVWDVVVEDVPAKAVDLGALELLLDNDVVGRAVVSVEGGHRQQLRISFAASAEQVMEVRFHHRGGTLSVERAQLFKLGR